MKNFLGLLFFVFCFGTQFLLAQPIITSSSFPDAGDVLKTRIGNKTNGDFNYPAGENQHWSLMDVTKGLPKTVTYLPAADASGAAMMPNADSYVNLGLGEEFFESTNSHFASLGIIGGDLTGLGLVTNTVYNPPLVQKRALTYDPNDSFVTHGKFTLRFAKDDLPPAIADTLSGLSQVPFDSLGFGNEITTTMRMDGWGKLDIPGGSYDVIRESRVTIRRTSLEVKLPLFGWTDVTNLLTGSIGGVGNFVNDTTYTQHYHADGVKETIAIVTLNKDLQSVAFVEYKDNDVSATPIIEDEVLAFTVSPNPTSGAVRLSFERLNNDGYLLELIDVSGKVLRKIDVQPSDNLQMDVSMDDLTPGNYWWVLRNKEGAAIAKQMVVLQ